MKLRSRVHRLLAKYDYLPDLEEKAVNLVLEQAERYAAHRAIAESHLVSEHRAMLRKCDAAS